MIMCTAHLPKKVPGVKSHPRGKMIIFMHGYISFSCMEIPNLHSSILSCLKLFVRLNRFTYNLVPYTVDSQKIVWSKFCEFTEN